MIEPRQIVRAIRALPTMGPAVTRLMALKGDPMASAEQYEEAIRPDPALTMNLLKLINSAYFGCSREVDSIRRAVILLGSKKIVEAAVGAALTRLIPEIIPGYGLSSKAFWKHCIAVAVYSHRLAVAHDPLLADGAFTAGLLHDIGKLAVGTYLDQEAERFLSMIRNDNVSMNEAESEVLGLDHTRVGEMICEEWKLPDSICRVVRWHHDPMSAAAGCVLVDLVHVADCLAHAMGFGVDVGELSRKVTPGSLERTGLRMADLELIACESHHECEELSSIYAGRTGGS